MLFHSPPICARKVCKKRRRLSSMDDEFENLQLPKVRRLAMPKELLVTPKEPQIGLLNNFQIKLRMGWYVTNNEATPHIDNFCLQDEDIKPSILFKGNFENVNAAKPDVIYISS